MASNCCKIFIYTALPCEARPLVEHFKLKKDTTVHPFEVYSRQDIGLTVTGLGKCAMSAGVAYSQALFSVSENPVMMNIGIAGHRDHVLGSAFLIDRILDGDSGDNYYPPLLFTPSCATDAVRTASRPQLGYDQPYLYDMEASAFYETATRFTSAELAQCLKVVSDNRSSPAERIKPHKVSSLIAAHIQSIEQTLTELIRLAGLITAPEPKFMAALMQRCHFTASEQAQLKKQLNRWYCLTDHQDLEIDWDGLLSGRDVLRWLEQQIGGKAFRL